MARRLLIALLLGLWISPALGQKRAEVVVVGPAGDVFSTYGHAGVLLIDPRVPRLGRLYNFGITNFNRPNYIRDFLTGKVHFWGKSRSWPSAIAKWKKHDRTVLRYPLSLSEAQIKLLKSRMQHDVHPKHREYIYDTFRENCATRIRDYLDMVTQGAVFEALGREATTRSYHDDVRVAFSEEILLQFLTEIIPGIEMDRARTPWELSYLPAYLGEALRDVKITNAAGEVVPLAGAPIVEHTRQAPSHIDGWPYTAQAILLGFAALLLLLAWWCPRWGPRWRGLLAFGWTFGASAFACLVLFIHSWTAWPDMRESFVMVGFLPLDALLLISATRLFFKRRVRGLPLLYLKLRLMIVLAMLAAHPFLEILRGSVPPRVVAAAGLFFLLRALSAPPRGKASRVSSASRA